MLLSVLRPLFLDMTKHNAKYALSRPASHQHSRGLSPGDRSKKNYNYRVDGETRFLLDRRDKSSLTILASVTEKLVKFLRLLMFARVQNSNNPSDPSISASRNFRNFENCQIRDNHQDCHIDTCLPLNL